MINLKWYAAIGYGDILLPISYVHNISDMFQEEVSLEFLYKESSTYKYNQKSSECLWQQVDYLNSICMKEGIAGVNISHTFNDNSNIRWTGYHQSLLQTNKFHNQWYTNIKASIKPNKIVIGSTLTNMVPLKDYDRGRKMWKSTQDWNALIRDLDKLADHYEIVHIDYTTPIAEAVNHLSEATLFIGYHGGMAWLARFCGTPSIILVENNTLSRNMFSNAIILESLSITDRGQLSNLIEHAHIISRKYKNQFDYRNHSKEHFEKILQKILYVK